MLPDFQLDNVWIQKRLRGRISQKQVSDAIRFLVENEFIEIGPDGSCSLPQLNLECREGVYRISLGEFHRQVLDLAHKAIQDVPRESRYIVGHTVVLTKDEFQQAKKIYDEAILRIEELKSKNPALSANSEIFHFEFAAFPMTEKSEEGT